MHPTIEELMLREALRHLTARQKMIWEYWNFDKWPQSRIASKLDISQQAVDKTLKSIARRVERWIKSHEQVYETLKGALK